MQFDTSWTYFMESISDIKNDPIPDSFIKQFKTKDQFIYPMDKKFIPLSKRIQSDERLRTQRKWDKDCKMFLLWTMIKYFQIKGKEQIDPVLIIILNLQKFFFQITKTSEEWEELSQILNIDQHSLKARWITLINPKQKSQNWTENEDNVIKESMKQRMHKHIWTQIAVKLYEMNICPCARTPKQVRERWINYLNPCLRKDLWLMKEDLNILNTVLKKGKRWSYIAKKLEGRTENQVKNRYKSLINKIWTDDEMDENEAIMIYVRRNQASINSNKHGIIGKRGRHKVIRKQRQEIQNNNNQQEYSQDDQIIDEENDQLINSQTSNFSPLQPKIQNKNKKLKIKRQISKSQKYNQQIKTKEAFDQYQRDVSNFNNQINFQQNNSELKFGMMNQAIDQIRQTFISPQFQGFDNSGCLIKSKPITPEINLPNLNGGISPYVFRMNEEPLKLQQQQDQSQIQKLMNLYQFQLQELLPQQNKLPKIEQIPQQSPLQYINSALLGSAMIWQNSPFGSKSAKLKEEVKVDQFIKSEDNQNYHISTPQINFQLSSQIDINEQSSDKKLQFLSDQNPIAKYNQRRENKTGDK